MHDKIYFDEKSFTVGVCLSDAVSVQGKLVKNHRLKKLKNPVCPND